MSNAVLTRLTEERSAAVEFIDGLLSQVAEEGRDLVETEQRSLDSYRERIDEIDKQMKPIAEFESRRASAIDIGSFTKPHAPARTEPRSPFVPGGGLQTRSFGDLYVESDDYMEMRGRAGTRFSDPTAQRARPRHADPCGPRGERGPRQELPAAGAAVLRPGCRTEHPAARRHHPRAGQRQHGRGRDLRPGGARVPTSSLRVRPSLRARSPALSRR